VVQFLQSVVDGLFYENCRLSKGKRRIGDDRFADVETRLPSWSACLFGQNKVVTTSILHCNHSVESFIL
jgi:hypothetical protein